VGESRVSARATRRGGGLKRRRLGEGRLSWMQILNVFDCQGWVKRITPSQETQDKSYVKAEQELKMKGLKIMQCDLQCDPIRSSPRSALLISL
jgi:hypothetical protein